jgi:murein DD-endopeptidase MepM/ murein hydrolase activator NlpD
VGFHPVVVFPPDGVVVLDLSRAGPRQDATWSVGRYDEVRAIYTQALFGGDRCVHMGVDLGAPAGVAVHAFDEGRVVHAGTNPADGDYGPTLVTEHSFGRRPLYVLLGHLSRRSLERSPPGRVFRAGDVLGWIGETSENGGWPPHVHVQLSWERPATHDLQGAVTLADRAAAKERYPDPALILGHLPPAR